MEAGGECFVGYEIKKSTFVDKGKREGEGE